MSKPWYDDARNIDQLCYYSRMADFPRGTNRALIESMANGAPPYTQTEVEENGIKVNFNSLSMTRLAHDARAQFLQGFVKPGKDFTASTDYGPKYKRTKWSQIVSKEVNRVMKKSPQYFEVLRGQFALLVLHGISPSVWEDQYCWRPRVIGIEDTLLPSGTLVGFENLPHLILFRSFTAMELKKLVYGPQPDPGWNKGLVTRCIEWVDEQATNLMNHNWPEVWSPQKRDERIKEQAGFYGADKLPTIDCFDTYVYVDDKKQSGWVRRIILDTWGAPSGMGVEVQMSRGSRTIDSIGESDFLYTSKSRRIASKLSEIAAFQFADLSAVAPFRYHSVRSLGFLIYALCHVENRLRCKFNESVFEALMMYFRVKSGDEAQRALKVDLVNRGFIDEALQFIPAAERWQVNANLVQLGISENEKLLQTQAGSFTPTADYKDRTEKTKFQVMAELNVTQSLVSAALSQAYQYKTFEYEEIFRRFCIRGSSDAGVLEFQARCVRQGVPLKQLDPSLWDIEPERVMGGGNKTMELAIAEQLMQWRQMYDPDSQRMILRDATAAITDDPARAETLVPEQAVISSSIHAAQADTASIMLGLPVQPVAGINHQEYVQALLANMALIIQRIRQTSNVGTQEEITGLNNMAAHVEKHLQILAQDKEAKQMVAEFSNQLGKLMNIVKGFEQRLQEQMQKQQQAGQNGQPQMDPKDQAKILATEATAKQKTENLKQSHAIKTAQRAVQFEQEQIRENQRNAAEIERENLRTAQELQHNKLGTAQELVHNRLSTEQEMELSRRAAKEEPNE